MAGCVGEKWLLTTESIKEKVLPVRRSTSGEPIFANGAQMFGFIRLFQELPGYYERQVGFDLDASPGGNAVQKTELSSPVEGANNIGFQGGPVDTPCFGCEGGPLSQAANQITGINAVAGLHDVFQTSMGTSIFRDVLNVSGMPVAVGVTYGGF